MLPTLVLLPGMDGTGELFAPFVTALGNGFPTTILDYPKNEALDYPALTDLVRSRLPTDQPFVLLAESFSGPIAVTLAASQPSRLLGLILCASFVRNPRPALRWMESLMPLLSFNRVPTALIGSVVLNRLDHRVAVALKQALLTVDTDVLHTRVRAVLDVDVTAQLAQINVPVLYLGPSADRVVPRSAWRWISEQSRNCEIVELGGPHLILQVAPREAATLVKNFLVRLQAT